MYSPPVDGPKDPWPHVLSLPGRFVGDPACWQATIHFNCVRYKPYIYRTNGEHPVAGVPGFLGYPYIT